MLRTMILIKPTPIPSCKTCIYYKKPGDCVKFHSQDPVSGEIIYQDALQARLNLHQCGLVGKHFYPRQN